MTHNARLSISTNASGNNVSPTTTTKMDIRAVFLGSILGIPIGTTVLLNAAIQEWPILKIVKEYSNVKIIYIDSLSKL